MFVRFVDSLVTAACVFGGVYALSWLDKHPLPHFGPVGKGGIYDWDLHDIKFWCPPHAAIAVIVFTAETLPSLLNIIKACLIFTISAIATVELGEKAINDPMMLRAAVCGTSMFAGKFLGSVFPPAGALAVLFVENSSFRNDLGRWYCMCPGLSGTVVLLFLAAIKIGVYSVVNKMFGSDKAKTNSGKTKKKN